jgi:hypothetical protein
MMASFKRRTACRSIDAFVPAARSREARYALRYEMAETGPRGVENPDYSGKPIGPKAKIL